MARDPAWSTERKIPQEIEDVFLDLTQQPGFRYPEGIARIVLNNNASSSPLSY